MNRLQPQILIVDDDSDLRNLLCNVFDKKGWLVQDAKDGRQALLSLHKFKPDIILMDIEMPVRDGISACRIIRRDINIGNPCPVIMMGTSPDRKQIVQSIEAGCDDFILKPFKFDVLIDKVENLIEFQKKIEEKEKPDYQIEEQEEEIIIYSRQVIKKVFTNAMKGEMINYPVVQKVVHQMLDILHKENNLPVAYKIKSYDDYTYIHSINVASLGLSFAYHLKWSDADLQIVGEGGFFHDIGKTRLDLQILMKKDKLNDSEFSEVKKHPLNGKDILLKQGIDGKLFEAVTEHHEQVGGNGYPFKLKNEQLSNYGKIIAIVDAYDALTTDRCYKRAVASKEAIQIMQKESGHFDLTFLNEFASLILGDVIGK